MTELINASPANIIGVTNTNDSGPGSLRNALAVAHDGDTIDATGVSGTILLTSGALQITHAPNSDMVSEHQQHSCKLFWGPNASGRLGIGGYSRLQP